MLPKHANGTDGRPKNAVAASCSFVTKLVHATLSVIADKGLPTTTVKMFASPNEEVVLHSTEVSAAANVALSASDWHSCTAVAMTLPWSAQPDVAAPPPPPPVVARPDKRNPAAPTSSHPMLASYWVVVGVLVVGVDVWVVVAVVTRQASKIPREWNPSSISLISPATVLHSAEAERVKSGPTQPTAGVADGLPPNDADDGPL